MRLRGLKVSVFLFFFCWLPMGLLAQNNSGEKVRLTDWLQELQNRFGASFSYNADLFRNIELPKADCATLSECLELISQSGPLKFEAVDAENYLVIPERKEASFEVKGEQEEVVTSLQVSINKKTPVYLKSENGNYTLPGLFPTDTIFIASSFYETVVIGAEELLAGGVWLQLTPEVIDLQEVVVVDYLTSGVDSRLSDHSMLVSMDKLGLLAGQSNGDILTVLKNIPGIRTPDGKPGSLNFRGSTFDQTLIFLDEIPIYHTGHFFGTISPYNAIVVDKVEIHRGTLPSRWGGRVGGLINIQTDNDLVDSLAGTVQVNSIFSGAKLKTPIIKNKLGVSLAVRANHPIDNLSPRLEAFNELNFQGSRIDPQHIDGNNIVLENQDIEFLDMNGKLVYNIHEDHQATVSFINITNRFAAHIVNNQQGLSENQQVDLDNWGITGKWQGKLTEKIKTSVALSRSELSIFDRNEEIVNGMSQNPVSATNTLNDVRLTTNIDFQVNRNLKINSGYTWTSHELFFQVLRNGPTNLREQDADLHSVHAAVQKDWGTRFTATLGLHSDYYEPLSKIFFDPRLTMSYKASKHLYIKGSGGRSRQFISQSFNQDFDDFRINNQFWNIAIEEEEVLVAYQGMLGALFEHSDWLVDLEIYRRNTDNIMRDDGNQSRSFGSIVSTGADLFVKKGWTPWLETWVSYSLSRVESDFNDDGLAFYDQPHILNLTGLVDLKKWKFAVTWGYISGMPVELPTLIQQPFPPNPGGPLTLDVPYEDRFPAQHQLDLSATYSFSNKKGSWLAVVGLSLLNVYDQENIINVYQNNPRIDDPYRHAVGFAPDLHCTFSF